MTTANEAIPPSKHVPYHSLTLHTLRSLTGKVHISYTFSSFTLILLYSILSCSSVNSHPPFLAPKVYFSKWLMN